MCVLVFSSCFGGCSSFRSSPYCALGFSSKTRMLKGDAGTLYVTVSAVGFHAVERFFLTSGSSGTGAVNFHSDCLDWMRLGFVVAVGF